jgi:microcystin-dependent protein
MFNSGSNTWINSQLNVNGEIIPVGTIVAIYGTNVQQGWLLCNGSTFNTSQYPQLFTYLGSSTLPDLRGVFLRGLDNGRGIDVGRVLRSYQTDSTKLPNNNFTTNTTGNHTHTTDTQGDHAHSYSINTYTQDNYGTNWALTGPYNPTSAINRTTSTAGAHSHTTTTAGSHSHTINGGDIETRPNNIALYYIIKALL